MASPVHSHYVGRRGRAQRKSTILPEPGNFNVEIPYSSLRSRGQYPGYHSHRQSEQSSDAHCDRQLRPGHALCFAVHDRLEQGTQPSKRGSGCGWQVGNPTGRHGSNLTNRLRPAACHWGHEWTNYEVTVPVTVHARYSPYFGIGIVTGWQGHTASPCDTLVSGNFISATQLSAQLRPSVLWSGMVD